ncbi:hypothetical protein GCM10018771_19010 [Streptomyces cellulosae]|nr:hypothetical protein GCM10018771_19010 [Streptomyces cellulosae]
MRYALVPLSLPGPAFCVAAHTPVPVPASTTAAAAATAARFLFWIIALTAAGCTAKGR